MADTRGFQLVELVVSLAVLAALALLTVPSLLGASAALRVDLAAHEVAGALQEARSLAIRHGRAVAVRFYPEPRRVGFAHFVDGDGDGVRNADILRGVDRPLTPLRWFAHLGGRVGFGFPPGPAPRDPSSPRRRLGRLEDPIRFNDSELASYNSLGGGTAGSLYLTDGRSRLTAVRLHGATGRLRILRWDPEADAWR
jgi:type II secretory pathway pseudopilin PulG